MFLLFTAFVIMIGFALIITVLLFKYKHESISNSLLLYQISFSFFAIVFYIATTNLTALQQWLNGGMQHYQLLTQFEELGGLEGAITKVKDRLSSHPEDVKGWNLLGKLYMAKHDEKQARLAFQHAVKN